MGVPTAATPTTVMAGSRRLLHCHPRNVVMVVGPLRLHLYHPGAGTILGIRTTMAMAMTTTTTTMGQYFNQTMTTMMGQRSDPMAIVEMVGNRPLLPYRLIRTKIMVTVVTCRGKRQEKTRMLGKEIVACPGKRLKKATVAEVAPCHGNHPLQRTPILVRCPGRTMETTITRTTGEQRHHLCHGIPKRLPLILLCPGRRVRRTATTRFPQTRDPMMT
mmetsp:Transcript_29073/g.78678  ORF Transcript_29073/g.78678 Transcript_29073/m.78678 type:complete len:217 (+) Transcript_29073:863-1513(+)